MEDNLFEGNELDSLILSTIKENYPDLPENKKKEVYEKTKSEILNLSGEARGIPRYPEAGSFDCFILEETITTKVFLMKEVEKTKSWYAYGIGLVKEITYDKNGKLISTMILNEIKF